MARTVVEVIKDFIKHIDKVDKNFIASEFDIDERVVRRAISELCKENIIFVPKGKGQYIRCKDHKTAERTYRILIKTVRTIYFNRILPLKNLIKDEVLLKEIGQLALILEEGEK